MASITSRDALVAALAVLVWGGHASASEAALSYESPGPECPSRPELERRLRARGITVDDAARARVSVTIERRGSSHVGTTTITLGETSSRTLTDPSCSSLVDALAVVVAVALMNDETPEPPPDPAPPPRPMEPPPPIERMAPGRFSFGAELVIASAIAPRVAVGGGPFVAMVPLRREPFALGLRLALLAVSAGAVDVPAGRGSPAAAFTELGGRLEIAGLSFGRRVEILGGASLGVGVLRAEGIDVGAARTVWAPIVDVGPVLRVRLPLGPIALEVGGTLVFPLIRPTFTFAPTTVIHEVPPVGAVIDVAIAIDRTSR